MLLWFGIPIFISLGMLCAFVVYERVFSWKWFWTLALFIVLAASASAQAAYFSSNAWTASRNVAPGQSANILTIPYAKVTVCANPATPATGATCTNQIPVFSDSSLSHQIQQPLTADAQGFFGFYIPQGYYSFSLQNSIGSFLGTYAFSIAGAGAVGPIGPPGTVTASGVNGDFNVPGTLTVGGSTALNPRTMNLFGDSYTCDVFYTNINGCLGQNIVGTGATQSRYGWQGRIAQSLQLNLNTQVNNYAGAGAQTCDVARWQLFPNFTGPTNAQINFLMTGLNDAKVNGAGSYEQTFLSCYKAMVSHVSTPQANKVSAPTCPTTGSTATDNTYAAMPGVTLNAGGSVSCSITAPVSAIYFLYRMTNGSSGTFTYSVDGGSTTTVATGPTPIISTGGLNTTTAPGFVRVAVSPGTHSVRFASTTGDATIYELEAPPSVTNIGVRPNLIVGSISYQANNNQGVATKAYYDDAKAAVNSFINDGMPVRLADLRRYLSSSNAYFAPDGIHPNDNGHELVAQAFIEALGVPTAPSLNQTDDTGVWPHPLVMSQTSTTGNGVFWTMENLAQGGSQTNFSLAGINDPFGVPLGCLYRLGVSPSGGSPGTFLMDYDCGVYPYTNPYHVTGLQQQFTLGALTTYLGGQGAATIAVQSGSGSGSTASCAVGYACNSLGGTVNLNIVGAPPTTASGVANTLLKVTLPVATRNTLPGNLACTVSLAPPTSATTVPQWTYGDTVPSTGNGGVITLYGLNNSIFAGTTYVMHYTCTY